MKRTTALILCLLAGIGAGCAGEADAPAQATVAGVTIVEETGLLEADELPENTFAFEIMPEADDHIAQMQIMYFGGPDHESLGQLVLVPEVDKYFTRDDTFRRGFTVADESLLEDFTLSFVLVDESGNETQAHGDYTVNADYGVFYFVKIGGSREEGYTLSDH